MSPVGGFDGHDSLVGAPRFVSGEGEGNFIGSKEYYEQLRASSPIREERSGSAVGSIPGGTLGEVSLVFGGFAPMALSDPVASAEQIKKSQETIARFRDARIRAAELEAARSSSAKTYVDLRGNTWHYVVLGEASIRLDGCDIVSETVEVPDSIEGKPVEVLSSDACSASKVVREIVCPDTVTLVKPYAFRGNRRLKRLVLPAGVTHFDFTWIHCCDSLEELHLPGALEKLTSAVFDGPELKRLYIGASLKDVVPGAFTHSKLEQVFIDGSNPFLKTDGNAIYSHDGDWLVALATPVEEYAVQPGCKGLAKKAFGTFSAVRRVSLPEGLLVLDEFALARTGIEEFVAPGSLLRIADKAFYRCKKLERVDLGQALVDLGSEAFTGTAINELRIPKSIRTLGKDPAAESKLTYSGPDATFSIEEGSDYLSLDCQGCLYSQSEDGVHFARMMDPFAKDVRIAEGVKYVDEGAFYKHRNIKSVYLPKGVVCVGKGAFKDCFALQEVTVPSTLERLEDEAFLDSGLLSFRIPSSLKHIGEHALVTHGAHHGEVAPSLRSVDVAPDHDVFYMNRGMLLERRAHGGIRVLLCMSGQEVLRIPDEATAIAAYALNGQRGVRELYLHDGVRTVGVCGLGVDSALELVHIRLAEPLQGHNEFAIRFPMTQRGKQQVCLVLGMLDRIDVAKILRHYDTAIANAMNYNGKDSVGMSKYEQATRILARLGDPVFMEPSNRQLMRQIIESDLVEICVDIARHDDRGAFEGLFAQGFLDADNLDAVIDRVAMVQDASVTGYLLEAKRQRFGVPAFDFDL
ncbi:MAG: leucine-rich repeat protein [Coriobacteriia bacterium]|nr:leucine-rich repeat protein [Coriobacteriia bacterium]